MINFDSIELKKAMQEMNDNIALVDWVIINPVAAGAIALAIIYVYRQKMRIDSLSTSNKNLKIGLENVEKTISRQHEKVMKQLNESISNLTQATNSLENRIYELSSDLKHLREYQGKAIDRIEKKMEKLEL